MSAKVSLCMIVKNEEASLAACLASAADLVDEIIVVDTGSTDQTRAIAERHGARVFDFAWVNDFSAARNESLRHATGQWIFWLDADECLDELNRQRLRGLFSRLPDGNVAFVMTQLCLKEAALHGPGAQADKPIEQVRLFRNHPDIRWQHRVYEQIVPAVRRAGGELLKTDIVIQHPGYSNPELHRRKIERNLALAELEHREHPDDSYVMYSLGVFLQRLGRVAESLRYLQPCVERLPPGSNYAAKAYALLTQGYMQTGEGARALAACRAGRRCAPTDAELMTQEGMLLRASGDVAGAEACFAHLAGPGGAALDADQACWVRHNLAQIYRQTGRLPQAEAQWRAAVERQPAFALGWLELGELYIAMGRWDGLDQVLAHLQVDADQAENAAVLRARGLMARKDYAAARQILEETIQRWPRALRPRQALSHVLLFENKDPAAAQRALRDVLALDPNNAEAKTNLALLQSRAPAAPPASAAPPAPVVAVSAPPGGKRTAKPRVSLCMIVKNEQENLADCLKCIADLVDEIIVVDTGSTDQTRKIASQFGAHVYRYAWIDDFAAARNESIRHATGEWIFWLDADDRIDAANRVKLQNLFARLPDANVAYLMQCACSANSAGSETAIVDHVRLFRRHPAIRWENRVHERILPAVARQGGSVGRTDIVIQHVGYRDPVVYRRKLERNLRLLQEDARARPNEPVILYELGKLHLELGQPADAVPLLQRCRDAVPASEPALPRMYVLIGQALEKLGQPAEALAEYRAGIQRFPEHSELVFHEATQLLNLGDLNAAEAEFKRLLTLPAQTTFATTLDPALQGYKARHNLAIVYRRQQRHAEAAELWRQVLAEKPDFEPALQGLAACSLALEAQPESAKPQAVRPRVSLCMIVKNEEANLADCLRCVADLVDEIVIVDTGSTDRTKEIAAEFGARVFDFPWIDDFSAARNETLRHATGAWIFWMDADDRVDDANRTKLRAVFDQLGDENVAYFMACHSTSAGGTGRALIGDHARLFPHHPQIHWEYRVHEQVLLSLERLGGTTRKTDIVIQHLGYLDPQVLRSKEERKLQLLDLDLRDHPNDPAVLFNMGWTHLSLGHVQDAVRCLTQCLQRLPPKLSIGPKVCVLLARALRELGQMDHGLAICREGRLRYADHPELLWVEASLRDRIRDFAGAEACLLKLLQQGTSTSVAMGIDPGLTSYQTRHRLGALYYKQNRRADAERMWLQVVAEHPAHVDAWVGLADLYGHEARWDDLMRLIGRLQGNPERQVEALLVEGRMRMARKEYAAARAPLEAAVALAPMAVWPRMALSHVLLLEGRDWAAAERALMDVLALDPKNIEAQRNLAMLMAQQGRRSPAASGS